METRGRSKTPVKNSGSATKKKKSYKDALVEKHGTDSKTKAKRSPSVTRKQQSMVVAEVLYI